ncbi:MAG TPA: SpoIID/LytB domain-containing protein, partial [Elusimicrobiota bacterium]|nr:SpoIID/LytB domain-containing protein [Elusimicrobiota bacterium]
MRALASAALLLLALPARAADVEQTVRDSYGAYLQGRYDDAASGFRYLQTLNVTAPEPEANEALVQRDGGHPETALPLWIKASLLENANGFVWNQRGWTFLALGRARDAKESFQRAIDRSSTTAMQAEANLGLGLDALMDRKAKAGVDALRRAGISGPYAIAASAQLMADASLAIGDKERALSYLRQSLDVDPYNREALRSLVSLLNDIGDNRGAWLTARRELALDPTDEDALKVLKRNAPYIQGDPDEASGVRRIARPVLNPDTTEPALPVSSRTVRVGLYGAPDGRPATMTRCYLMMNSPFKVTAAAYGVMRDNGNAYDQWEVEWRPDSAVIEVRDSARNILFTSKQPFLFVPSAARGSVLVKSAAVTDVVGVDLGDREVRGAVEVVPNPWGFKLVNQVPLEQYLFGVVSVALPDQSPPEAYKAQAVVSRTAAAWAMGHHAQTQENFDLLDDRSVQQTIGVSGEMREGAEGVAATEGLVLSEHGLVALAPQTDDSGGRTEDGKDSGEPGMEGMVSVADAQKPASPWALPLDVEHFTHDAPPEGLYSEAAPGPTAAAARWMRIFEARDLRSRVERRKKIGRLLNVIVAGRTATGRVKQLKVVGADGELTYTGFKEIQGLLSPGSLRSALFTMQPLYDGKSLSRLVVWGAGTGTGLGFSRAGALGQAALGKPWRDIVRHYFPKYEVRD